MKKNWPSPFKHFLIGILCLSPVVQASAQEEEPLPSEKVEELFSQGVVVDLRDPVLQDGVLTTTKGGVITAPNIRIQAMNITYTRKIVDDVSIFKVEASEDLMLEYGDRVFVGNRMEFDFNTESGVIYEGTTVIEPWYIGGKFIRLLPNGEYTMEEGYITTCPNSDSEWQISANNVRVPKDDQLAADNIQVRFLKLPLFWVPAFKGNMKKILRAPVRWRVHWGGSQGPRLSMRYRIISRDQFNAFLRLDLRTRRGIGGGIETEYYSPDKKRSFLTRNYIANDTSVGDDRKRQRFRFEGKYADRFYDDKVTMDLKYDRLSDGEMPSDFDETDFNLETAQRTELILRRRHRSWIQSLITRVHINSFQSLKQELPTVEWRFRPFELGRTKIISDNDVKASYLDYAHADEISGVTDFNSSRLQTQNFLYRPFRIKQFTLTPRAGFVGTYYTNNPVSKKSWVGIGTFGAEANTYLYRHFGERKHIIKPYISYDYYTRPKTSPDLHYIFDFDDTWSSLNQMRFGFTNTLYNKEEGEIRPGFFADIYANSFFATKTIAKNIPKAYGKFRWTQMRNFLFGLDMAWNFRYKELDYYNAMAGWTRDENFALSVEYRDREAHDWRKADRTNFVLDSFRSEDTLTASELSDKRNTVLGNIFYRFSPKWICHAQSRYGDREGAKSFNEYQIDLITTVRCNWRLRFSYQFTKTDKRLAFYFKLIENKPDKLPKSPMLWY